MISDRRLIRSTQYLQLQQLIVDWFLVSGMVVFSDFSFSCFFKMFVDSTRTEPLVLWEVLWRNQPSPSLWHKENFHLNHRHGRQENKEQNKRLQLWEVLESSLMIYKDLFYDCSSFAFDGIFLFFFFRPKSKVVISKEFEKKPIKWKWLYWCM